MKIKLFLLLMFLYSSKGYTQVIYGANKYIEYHTGTLPIVISVPHGGHLKPSTIPDRTCNSPVTVMDANTIELAQQIDSAFVTATGCHPAIVYCNLHRTKIDCNRNIANGACGNALAETAWQEFYDFIESAEVAAQKAFGGKAIYIDLHGHGNPIQRLELGYLLYSNELALSDSLLNTAKYVGYSTIQNLVSSNTNGSTHAELLRGADALGTLLGNAGYPAVPSAQIPFPETSSNYFSGGYNVANHSSFALNNTVNGVQIECNYTNVRDSYSNRKKFAAALVAVVKNYLLVHQNINLNNCSVTNDVENNDLSKNTFSIFPNPATDFIELHMDKIDNNAALTITNTLGEIVLKTTQQTKLDVSFLPRGVYWVQAMDARKNSCTKMLLLSK
jgi:hypothetical protein